MNNVPEENNENNQEIEKIENSNENIIQENNADTELNKDRTINKEINRRLFMSLLTGAAVTVSGFMGYKWIINSKKEDEIPSLLRGTHEFNEKLSRYYYEPKRLSPTFPESRIVDIRVNGDVGMNEDFDPASWSLSVFGDSGQKTFSINDVKAFKPVEMITELKCIEGWSSIVKWKGTRLFDFFMKHKIISPKSKYIYMETPDKEYYVGLDIESAIHPQTLLVYEMNNQPLTIDHGAPLRLVIPSKYGIKNIKRIGTIKVMNTKPKDYWAEQGYDWYSGH